jgi:hypothetical protein
MLDLLRLDAQELYPVQSEPIQRPQIHDHYPVLIRLDQVSERCHHLHLSLRRKIAPEDRIVDGLSKAQHGFVNNAKPLLIHDIIADHIAIKPAQSLSPPAKSRITGQLAVEDPGK